MSSINRAKTEKPTLWLLVLVILFLAPHGIYARATDALLGKWADIQLPGAELYEEYVAETPSGPCLYPEYLNIRVLMYPYHWWLYPGISDTVEIEVRFHNQQSEPFNVSSSPEQWVDFLFYPDFYAVKLNSPVKSGSEVGRSFIGWWYRNPSTYETHPVNPPTSIPANSGHYSMRFNLWNLPPGGSILQLSSTSSTPGNLTVLDWLEGPFMVGTTQDLADTLNTLHQIGLRFEKRGEHSIALMWSDSILAINPYSIIGWMLKSRALDKVGTRSEALFAIDQVFWIMEDGLDPALPYPMREWFNAGLSRAVSIWADDMWWRTTELRVQVESYHTKGMYRK